MDEQKDLSIEYLQKRLDALGIQDIKVFWSENFSRFSRTDLEKELALILHTYLDGYKVPLKPIGDKLLTRKDGKDFTLVQDNDGHEYVIPLDKAEDFYAWLDSSDYEDGVEPPYLERKEGFIAFTGYRLDK